MALEFDCTYALHIKLATLIILEWPACGLRPKNTESVYTGCWLTLRKYFPKQEMY